MTYDNWCKHSHEIIKESEIYNKWSYKAKYFLLTNIGPRIAKLGKTGYIGCGFHYWFEQEFSKIINGLAISWQPCTNWCSKIEDDRDHALIMQVCYKFLLQKVRKSEKSVKKYKNVFKNL